MTRNDQNVSVLDSVLPYLAGDGGEVGALLLEYLNTRRGVPAATEARSSRRVVAAAAQARTFLAEKLKGKQSAAEAAVAKLAAAFTASTTPTERRTWLQFVCDEKQRRKRRKTERTGGERRKTEKKRSKAEKTAQTGAESEENEEKRCKTEQNGAKRRETKQNDGKRWKSGGERLKTVETRRSGCLWLP